jgi:hypothetical protein
VDGSPSFASLVSTFLDKQFNNTNL